MAGEFWLNDERFARLAPLLQADTRGVPQVDDRQVISGIVHVPISGGRWSDAPACQDPGRTLYNRLCGGRRRASGSAPSRRWRPRVGRPPNGCSTTFGPEHTVDHRRKRGNLPTRQPLARRTHDQTAHAGRWAWVWSPSSSPLASTVTRRSASLIGLTPSAALAAERACDSDALRRLLVARGTTNNHTQCAISKEATPVRARGQQMLQPVPPPSASLPSPLAGYERRGTERSAARCDSEGPRTHRALCVGGRDAGGAHRRHRRGRHGISTKLMPAIGERRDEHGGGVYTAAVYTGQTAADGQYLGDIRAAVSAQKRAAPIVERPLLFFSNSRC